MSGVGRGPAVGDSEGLEGRGAIETDAVAELGVDFAFRLNTDGIVTAVSGTVEGLIGETAEEAVGRSFERYVVEADLEAAREAVGAVLAGETIRGAAFRLDGERTTWVEVNSEAVVQDGEVVAVRGAAREATERRRSIERHSDAMKGSIDGMALLDDSGHYLFVNEAHAELYGYDREELVGSHWSRLYHDAEQRHLEREALPSMERAGSWRGTAIGRRKDGSTFRQELSLSTLDQGFVCVVRDVTEHYQREQIIDVLDRVLRHNLRNDMNVVLGEAGIIADEADGRTAEAARRIRDRARELLATSDTARTVREVVASEGDSSVTDLGAVVERCCREADGRVSVSVPDRSVPVDCTGVQHAITELVENALEHGSTEDGSGRWKAAASDADQVTDGSDDAGETVGVALSRLDGPDGARMAVLRVVDDGPGIPEMERRTLEEGRETPLRHGQGLGLWLVNWVVSRAGGELTVRDRDGGGTAVEVRLPLAEA
jgi:PAS domain S-box-containing protein